jgi:hypothetical protein
MKIRYTLSLGLAAAVVLAASRIEIGRTPEKTFGAVTTVDRGPRTHTGQAKGPSARPDALYRWRGADGQVHVQSRPPPQGMHAEAFPLTREDASGEDSAGRRPEATPSALVHLWSLWTDRGRHVAVQRPPDTVDHGEADTKIKSFNRAKAERYLAERDRHKR